MNRGLYILAALVTSGELPGLGFRVDFLSGLDALGNWDAGCFDALAQCAVFGEVIYG